MTLFHHRVGRHVSAPPPGMRWGHAEILTGFLAGDKSAGGWVEPSPRYRTTVPGALRIDPRW